MRRFALWAGVDGGVFEAASIELGDQGLKAEGVQLGAEPAAYRLDYRLEVGEGFLTRRLRLRAAGEGWARSLDLVRSPGDGRWLAEAEATGEVALPAPGGDLGAIAEAVDCDLALSPLTNLMPIRRHRLAEGPGSVDLLVAWVSVPDLGVRPYRQRYEHVRCDSEGGAVVRFVDRGPFEGFVAELELDRDGIIAEYPGLARRL